MRAPLEPIQGCIPVLPSDPCAHNSSVATVTNRLLTFYRRRHDLCGPSRSVKVKDSRSEGREGVRGGGSFKSNILAVHGEALLWTGL